MTDPDSLATQPLPGCGGPYRMDAPGGPVCSCGRPSRHQSGWCGITESPASPERLRELAEHIDVRSPYLRAAADGFAEQLINRLDAVEAKYERALADACQAEHERSEQWRRDNRELRIRLDAAEAALRQGHPFAKWCACGSCRYFARYGSGEKNKTP